MWVGQLFQKVYYIISKLTWVCIMRFHIQFSMCISAQFSDWSHSQNKNMDFSECSLISRNNSQREGNFLNS